MMLSVVPLKQLGYQLDFFKLPLAEAREVSFTYYTFDDSRLEKQPGSWDIVGMRHMGTLPIDVQLLSIDEEALLEWPDFEALRDASGFLFLELPHLQALLCFFEQWGDPDMAESEGQHSHFRLLDAEALRTYQVNRWIIESSTGNYYLYMPDEGTGYAGECLLTVLTDHWGMPHHLIGPLCRHERVTGMPHLPSWLLLAPLAEADPLTPQPITRRRLAAIVAILRQLPFDLAQPSEYFLFFCAR